MPLSSVVGASSILRPGVCTSTSRPASPFEGQTIYETDTDTMRVWNGSAWRLFAEVGSSVNGNVVQVVSTTKTDTFVSGSVSAGSEVDITGLTATITPTSTSSKILVMFHVYGCTYQSNLQRQMFAARVYRGTTLISAGAADGNRSRVAGQNGQLGGYDGFGLVSAVHLDEPATTNSTTYKIAAVHTPFDATSATGIYVNRLYPDTNANNYPRSASYITLMEVSA